MKSLTTIVCVGVLSLSPPILAQASSPSPGREVASTTSAAERSFEVLKGLAGTWTGQVTTEPRNPEIDGSIQVTMRMASGGSALVHEIAPGGVPEPTMIYLEGDRLTLVHYCEAGNRPRLVAQQSSDSKRVAFEFFDISGSKTPAYVQSLVFSIISADRHIEDWTFQRPGDKSLHAHFELTRAKEGAVSRSPTDNESHR